MTPCFERQMFRGGGKSFSPFEPANCQDVWVDATEAELPMVKWHQAKMTRFRCTLPETNIAPENGWLEY